ncbi:hypothetical protein B2J88_40805 [Rhodococcus sp. SRB_17]|nr:hypothetical protein [Rhodococcus sp. SRB_17]OYD70607.1 hypothetical protein BDB13_4235 [Rhodococcus sp. OK302]
MTVEQASTALDEISAALRRIPHATDLCTEFSKFVELQQFSTISQPVRHSAWPMSHAATNLDAQLQNVERPPITFTDSLDTHETADIHWFQQ